MGKIYLAIPFDKLAALIVSPSHSKSGLGRKSFLDVKGGIALQFLRHYMQISDAPLIERINTDNTD